MHPRHANLWPYFSLFCFTLPLNPTPTVLGCTFDRSLSFFKLVFLQRSNFLVSRPYVVLLLSVWPLPRSTFPLKLIVGQFSLMLTFLLSNFRPVLPTLPSLFFLLSHVLCMFDSNYPVFSLSLWSLISSWMITRPMGCPEDLRRFRHLHFFVVSLILPQVSALLFGTGGVSFHHNSTLLLSVCPEELVLPVTLAVSLFFLTAMYSALC